MKKLCCGLAAVGLLFGAVEQVRSDFIYWCEFNGGVVQRANLDGSGKTKLVSGLSIPLFTSLDLPDGTMYWSEQGRGNIWRANLDGSGPTILVSGVSSPSGTALDIGGRQIYWAFGTFGVGGIQRANFDGSGLTTLVSGVNGPRGILLDLPGGKMYFSEGLANQEGFISRYNLDGSGRETFLRGLSLPTQMAVDVAGGKFYWADAGSSTIRRANLDGSDPEILIQRVSEIPGLALDLTDGKLYWSGFGTGMIERANLDGTGQEILLTGLNAPTGIALDLSAPVPILLTGYSTDVISDMDPSTRFAQPFDTGTFAWFEAGAVDDNGVAHTDGLPAGLTFTSVTSSGATYQIQPANASSVLQLGGGQTGTLTLMTPSAYRKLYAIASSGDGTATSVGSGNINFADGSTQAFSYNIFDWCNGPGGLHPEAVLSGPIGRADVGLSGTAFTYYQDCDFEIYETVIPIDPSHAGVAIVSIDFTAAPDAYSSNIFGVSGK
jgi:hypothetical protein